MARAGRMPLRSTAGDPVDRHPPGSSMRTGRVGAYFPRDGCYIAGRAGLAQLVERVICNHDAAGSIPATGTKGSMPVRRGWSCGYAGRASDRFTAGIPDPPHREEPVDSRFPRPGAYRPVAANQPEAADPLNPSLPPIIELIFISKIYDVRDRQATLRRRALGCFRRRSCGSLPVCDRCPRRRRWPFAVLRHESACARAGCVRRRVGRRR